MLREIYNLNDQQIDVFEFFEMLDTLLLRFRVDRAVEKMHRTKKLFREIIVFLTCKR